MTQLSYKQCESLGYLKANQVFNGLWLARNFSDIFLATEILVELSDGLLNAIQGQKAKM